MAKTRSVTVKQLYDMWKAHNLVTTTVIQRASNVWNPAFKADLIDSVIKEYYIPPIPLMRKKQHGAIRFNTVDGKQRLETIFHFIENNFPLGKDYHHEAGTLASPVVAGYRFIDFPEDAKESFLAKTLEITELEEKFPEYEKFLFKKLNSNAVRLNRHEIRNAEGGAVIQLVRDIIKNVDSEAFMENRRGNLNSFVLKIVKSIVNDKETGSIVVNTQAKNLDDFVMDVRYRNMDNEIAKIVKDEALFVLNKLLFVYNHNFRKKVTSVTAYFSAVIVMSVYKKYEETDIDKYLPKTMEFIRLALDAQERTPESRLDIARKLRGYTRSNTYSETAARAFITEATMYLLTEAPQIHFKEGQELDELTEAEKSAILANADRKGDKHCVKCGRNVSERNMHNFFVPSRQSKKQKYRISEGVVTCSNCGPGMDVRGL